MISIERGRFFTSDGKQRNALPRARDPQERKDDVIAKLLRALLRTCNVHGRGVEDTPVEESARARCCERVTFREGV
eukprot:scaffold52094_cov77-Phaeocystis_antarctica.AAC.4